MGFYPSTCFTCGARNWFCSVTMTSQHCDCPRTTLPDFAAWIVPIPQVNENPAPKDHAELIEFSRHDPGWHYAEGAATSGIQGNLWTSIAAFVAVKVVVGMLEGYAVFVANDGWALVNRMQTLVGDLAKGTVSDTINAIDRLKSVAQAIVKDAKELKQNA